jgi:hypothetical protein
MTVLAKRSKAAKVARRAKKKSHPKMKTKTPAMVKQEKPPVDNDDGELDEEVDMVDPDTEAEVELDLEPKTRLDLIRLRHRVMKKEIDQIRVALEEDPDD